MSSNGKSESIRIESIPDSINLTNDWEVSFPKVKEGSKTFEFNTLYDWTKHRNQEVKYYSGTATYEKTFKLKKRMISNDLKLMLDLGKVDIAARVILNGQDLGVLWKAPYKLDISDAVVKGKNKLKIEVTNQWTNRLIGDKQYPDVSGYYDSEQMPDWYKNNEPAPLGKRSTFTTYDFFKDGGELIPAGLIGPVTINYSKVIKMNK